MLDGVRGRKVAADRLSARDLNMLFGAIIDASDNAVISTDLHGHIISWNPAAERLYGYSANEAIGRPAEMLFEATRLEPEIMRRISEGETVRMSISRPLGRNPQAADVEIVCTPLRRPSGEVFATSIIARNIALLKKAEARIAVEHQHLQTLLETATDGIHVLDDRGNIVFFSNSFAEMLGYSKEDMARLNVRDWSVTPPERLADPMPRGSEPTVEETQLRRSDGTLIDVEISARCIVLSGTPYIYRSSRDIGRRLRTERDNQQHLAELERVNKELDDFVYIASHDLRSPLRGIDTLAQWILDDDTSVDSRTGERLRTIKARAQRVARLLDDVMKYARAGRGELQSGSTLSGAALIADIAATLQVPAGYRIDTDDSLSGVLVRRMPLEQILHNLIGNAIKHHDKSQGFVRIWVTEQGNRLRFFVADDGPGIPAAYRDSVFDMFSTLKSRDDMEGSGMGLALVRKLVKRLGGECGVMDSEGRGACLWFDWPQMSDTRSDNLPDAAASA
jgi:PAS domain S-box-containing protein